MLDFGFSEILLTSAIALVVLGPERLPKVARQVGNWMGRARAMARQLSEQLEREVSADELLKSQTRKLEAPAPNRIAPLPIAPPTAVHQPVNLATPVIAESTPSSQTGHAEFNPPAIAERSHSTQSGHAEYNPPVAATDTHMPAAVAAAPNAALRHAAGADDTDVPRAAAQSTPQVDTPLPPNE